jgi:hypothetical protein
MRSARVHCQPLIFLIATFLLLVPVSGNTLPQSIASGDGYKNLDPCAQSCVAGRDGPCDSGPIEAAIGCNMDCNDWGRNDCFCRGDKQSIATSFLSSCISVACTLGNPAIDISSGAGLYTDYCLSNGYALVPGATLTPATFPAATAVKPTDTTPPNGAAATTVYVSTTVYVQISEGARHSLSPWIFLVRAIALVASEFCFGYHNSHHLFASKPQFKTLLTYPVT